MCRGVFAHASRAAGGRLGVRTSTDLDRRFRTMFLLCSSCRGGSPCPNPVSFSHADRARHPRRRADRDPGPAFGPGLTALTGETGAGKSIILDALGLAAGARADAGLVRRGAEQAQATAIFALAPDHPVWAYLEDKGLAFDADEDWCCAASSAPTAARAPSSTTRRPASRCCANWAPCCWRCTASTRPWACWTRAPTARCSTPSAAARRNARLRQAWRALRERRAEVDD